MLQIYVLYDKNHNYDATKFIAVAKSYLKYLCLLGLYFVQWYPLTNGSYLLILYLFIFLILRTLK